MMKSQALLMRAKRSRAFTLVELLVVIGIVALLLGIGTIAYRDFTRRQNITSSAQQVVSDMRLTQQYALSGYKPTGCSNTLSQYEFRWLANSQYSIVAVCGSQEVTVKTVNFPNGITMDRFNPPIITQIGFRPVTGGTDLSSEKVTAIRGNGTTFVQVIRIRPSGDISYD